MLSLDMAEVNESPQAESLRPIETPVTMDTLKSLAAAGYPAELHATIRLAKTPVSLIEGVGLLNIARRAEAQNLKQEAIKLRGLSELSDDPEWVAMFAPQAQELNSRADTNLKAVIDSESTVDRFKATPA